MPREQATLLWFENEPAPRHILGYLSIYVQTISSSLKVVICMMDGKALQIASKTLEMKYQGTE
jgi:hypothetical protein